MPTEEKSAVDLDKLLAKWARDRLGDIGVWESVHDQFEKWSAKIISDLKETYSDIAIRLFLNPVDMGKPEDYTASAVIKGECGDTIGIYLRTDKGIIKEAFFTTDGCESSVAACGGLVEMIKGMSEEDAAGLCGWDVLEYLGVFPEDSAHCCLLAVNTLKKALGAIGASPSIQ
ncbi:MAG: iron-sulfur cluster assembly scaffold protein [Elusimicrobia bacterium]|nr:iron-sulfur cluster assembly scaffold protein [Elusimicrobiota bacterium]